MSRYSIAKILCLALSALSFASCKSSSSSNTLFIYMSTNEEMGRKLTTTFEKETGIKVNFVRLSTGEAAARIEAEKTNPQASLWVGGPALGHAEAKYKDLITPYDSPATKGLPAGFKDPENYWAGFYRGIMAFVSNEEQLKKRGLKAPTSWDDLLNPKLKGLIQLPNPGTSGTSYNIITTLVKVMGEEKAFDYLKKLHKNVSQYTRSGEAPTKNAALGETVVTVGYVQGILQYRLEQKAPLVMTFPTEGIGYEIGGISLIKGGKQVELAKKFYDWIFSKSAAQILADFYIVPAYSEGVNVRPETELPKNLKLVDIDIDWAGKNKPRLVDTWNQKVNG